MARSRFWPPDDVTYGEWSYLTGRYPEVEAQERRERVALTMKRLTRRGLDAKRLHGILMASIYQWRGHAGVLVTRTAAQKRNKAVARAQKDLAKALQSLRLLLPVGYRATDDDLLGIRDLLLAPVDVPRTSARGGRPVEWKQSAEVNLRKVGVPVSDSRELMAALGFVSEL